MHRNSAGGPYPKFECGLLPTNGRWHVSFETIERTWEMDAAEVWAHTRSLDRPQVGRNDRARGFEMFKFEAVPDSALVPWSDANRPRSEYVT
ncbi:MAG: hypothetical protein EA417_22755 [Gammaproteobacteria bacterium]|nr:MAG: hypothetical protein EA417_22755 [Gammaproteobacteria bacterium]